MTRKHAANPAPVPTTAPIHLPAGFPRPLFLSGAFGVPMAFDRRQNPGNDDPHADVLCVYTGDIHNPTPQDAVAHLGMDEVRHLQKWLSETFPT